MCNFWFFFMAQYKKSSPKRKMTDLRHLQSPGRKAQHTAKWARIMTKWLITFNHRTGAKWNLVDFCGRDGCEARGVVDLIAIRKNHHFHGEGLKRGDLFDIVLIQTKGGSSARPTEEDVARLVKVAKHHRARAVVLAEWRRGVTLDLFRLKGSKWLPVSANDIFE